MNDDSKKNISISEILNGFAQLLEQHQAASEKRQAKSDEKLDKLVESVTKLTQSHIETRKDREFDAQRMERIEDYRKEQGERMATLASDMILVKERQENSKGKWDRVANIGNTLGIAALVAYLGLK